VTPEVTEQDEFWHSKQQPKKAPAFTPFHLPKDSPYGMIIAGVGMVICFAIIWHIWWLAIVGFVGLVASVIGRLNVAETEHTVTEEMVLADQKEHDTVRTELEGAL
jgi:cytochrome o ubiquinol oxidase subunit 1